MARLLFYYHAIARRWVAIMIAIINLIGHYDTILSQFLPPTWQDNLPTPLVALNAVPISVWVVGTMGVLIVAALEKAFRQDQSIKANNQFIEARHSLARILRTLHEYADGVGLRDGKLYESDIQYVKALREDVVECLRSINRNDLVEFIYMQVSYQEAEAAINAWWTSSAQGDFTRIAGSLSYQIKQALRQL